MEIFRKYRLLLPLLICTCIVLVMGVILVWPTDGGGEETETESETQSESEAGTLSPEPPTFRSDLSDYESYMNAASENFLILVNKQNTINAD